MRYWIPLIATLAISYTNAEDYTCPSGESTKTIKIQDGDSFSFNTNPGDAAKYENSMKCVVNYRLGSTCAKMRFNCGAINVDNKDGRRCRKGDKLFLARKAFCKTKTVDRTVGGNLKVRFISNARRVAGGAQCTMSCVEAVVPTTTAGSGGSGTGSGTSSGYTQTWLRGEGPSAHVHEGVQLADKSGWVAIGETLPDEGQAYTPQVLVRRVNTEAATQWSTTLGTSGKANVGYSVIEGSNALYAGVGLYQSSTNKHVPAVVALDKTTGATLWTTTLAAGQSGYGGVRSCIMDNTDIVCVGYTQYSTAGFVFVADEARPVVWRLDSSGNLLTEKFPTIEGVGQLAKIRKDATSGFVACSTGWGVIGGQDVNVVALLKLSDSLDTEWSQTYGMAGGNSQVFDMLVDNDGNYLLGGHTTVGDGVVNWDYLALKINSQTKAEMWRRTYGQPRGFDARYIHDEMYGVALDKDGNYLLLGGSGDEYTYSAAGTGVWSGWLSDEWGSYLVVVSPNGDKLYENFYGKKGGNNAGEWLSYDAATDEIMVYTDSDTEGGFGFLKLSPA